MGWKLCLHLSDLGNNQIQNEIKTKEGRENIYGQDQAHAEMSVMTLHSISLTPKDMSFSESLPQKINYLHKKY